MKPILEIKNISKKFRIHHEQKPYLSIRDSVSNLFKAKTGSDEDFWALKDISFDVMPGDSIGIIGKNGAGKSTLLKILSKITPPTIGKIITRGRIASLLEVGTGFHPELTGRENIFLNGSILGMKKVEIQKNFDAIVDFSGIEKFLDTPLKHYSSGMQLRLAFAVAAFLENEILIIDEVLAVGDAEFQKKCMGKMEDISKKQGRTVLFVSHDIEAISTLCNKGILLSGGEVKEFGSTQSIIKLYTDYFQNSFKVWEDNERPGDKIVKLNKIQLVDTKFSQIVQPTLDQEFGIQIEFEIFDDGVDPTPNFHFYTTTNICCFVAIAETKSLSKGKYSSVIWVPANFLNNQVYRLGIAMTTFKNMNIHFYEKEIIKIEVLENKSVRKNNYAGPMPGIVRPDLKSETKLIN